MTNHMTLSSALSLIYNEFLIPVSLVSPSFKSVRHLEFQQSVFMSVMIDGL